MTRYVRLIPFLLSGFLIAPHRGLAQSAPGNWESIRAKVGAIASGSAGSGGGAYLPLAGGVMKGPVSFDLADSIALDLKGKQIVGVSTIVTNRWRIVAPDYVFEPAYRLRSLDSVEQFIRAHRHLPDVPSAGEMQDKGLELVDMNFRLLRKIEELTLYRPRP